MYMINTCTNSQDPFPVPRPHFDLLTSLFIWVNWDSNRTITPLLYPISITVCLGMLFWVMTLYISRLGGISIVDWLQASWLKAPLSSKSVNWCQITLLTALLGIITNLAGLVDATFSQVRSIAELTNQLCGTIGLPVARAVNIIKCTQAPITAASVSPSIVANTPASRLVPLKLLAGSMLLLLLPLLLIGLERMRRLVRWFIEILIPIVTIPLAAVILATLGISMACVILSTIHIMTIITTSVSTTTSASFPFSSPFPSSIVRITSNMIDLLSWL